MNKLIIDNIENIRSVCEKHFVKSLYVFGSAATNTMNEASDIDFLYEIDLNSFIGWDNGEYDYVRNLSDMQTELQNVLGRKIDLIKNGYFRNKYFRTSVEQTKAVLYGS